MPTKVRTKTEADLLLAERRKDELLRECFRVFRSLTAIEATRNKRREMGLPSSPCVADDYLVAGAMAKLLEREGYGE